MNRNKIKKIARIYAANVVAASLGTGAGSDFLTDEEHELFAEEVNRISIKISPENFGDLDSIVLHVKGIQSSKPKEEA